MVADRFTVSSAEDTGDGAGRIIPQDRLLDALTAGGVRASPQMARAIRAVPRHMFLPGVAPDHAYLDKAFVTKYGPDGLPVSSSSQPSTMAIMLKQLNLAAGHRVLEIGTGTGYNTALIAEIVGETGAVTTVDIDETVTAAARRCLASAGYGRVTVACGDGADGLTAGAPYDRIIVTAGAWDLPPAWLDQLGPSGRLVVPLSLRVVQRSIAFERANGDPGHRGRVDHLESCSIRDCGLLGGFMRMTGAEAGPETTQRLDQPGGQGESGLYARAADGWPLDAAAFSAALNAKEADIRTGVRTTVIEAFTGICLWLALAEPGLISVFGSGAALAHGQLPSLTTTRRQVVTVALAAGRGAAVLTGAGTATSITQDFEVVARGFGDQGPELATRLADRVREWHAHGRPLTPDLRVSAYPRETRDDELSGQTVIDKRYTRLCVSWAGESDGSAGRDVAGTAETGDRT